MPSLQFFTMLMPEGDPPSPTPETVQQMAEAIAALPTKSAWTPPEHVHPSSEQQRIMAEALELQQITDRGYMPIMYGTYPVDGGRSMFYCWLMQMPQMANRVVVPGMGGPQ